MGNMLSLFPNFISTDSLFQKMVNMGAPWTNDIGKSMDLSFFTMYSGLKLPSFFVRSQISSTGQINSQIIAQTLWDLYGRNWQRLWDSYVLKYNPIDNYNVTETVERDETDNRTIGKTGSLASTVDGTGTTTYNATETNNLQHGHQIDVTENSDQTSNESGTSSLEHGENISTSDTTNNYIFGFNSTEQVPTDVRTSTGTEGHTGTDTTTTSGDSTTSIDNTKKESHSGVDKTSISEDSATDNVTKNVRADSTTEDTKDDNIINETISRTRSGNVGQNSYQELLSQEFELWKWNFFKQVFEDCDQFLCLSVFSCSNSCEEIGLVD